MVVLVFLLVSQLGQYLVTRSVSLMELLLTRFMRQQVEARILVTEAISYLVSLVTQTSWSWLEQVRQPKFLRQRMCVSLATVTLAPGNTRSQMDCRNRSFSLDQSGAECMHRANNSSTVYLSILVVILFVAVQAYLQTFRPICSRSGLFVAVQAKTVLYQEDRKDCAVVSVDAYLSFNYHNKKPNNKQTTKRNYGGTQSNTLPLKHVFISHIL